MSRITKSDLDRSFARFVHAAGHAGFVTTGWAFEHGSVTYGRAYRLVRIGEHGVHHNVAPGVDSFLGATAREAQIALRFAACMLEAQSQIG